MFKKLTTTQKVLLILNSIAALSLLTSYLAPYINPAQFWPVAFLATSYMVLLFINLIFLFFWLFVRNLFSLLSAISIVVGIPLLLHQIGFHNQKFEVKKASVDQIRIMDYNIYNFMQEGATDIKTTGPAFKMVKELQPDVLCFEEYLTRLGDYADRAGTIKKIMKSGYCYFKAYNVTPSDSTGLVIFTKYPIINRDTIPVLDNYIHTEGIYVDVKKGDQIFRIYTFHLKSTDFSRNDNAYLDSLAHRVKPDITHSKHILDRLKTAFIKRGIQVTAIRNYINKCPYPYIITGDLNDVPLSFAVKQMSAGLKNAFVEKGSGIGTTFYGNFPGFQLDYIMVSPQFDVINYKILKERISDHYPILSDLQLNSK